jgi:hypothetical protein
MGENYKFANKIISNEDFKRKVDKESPQLEPIRCCRDSKLQSQFFYNKNDF